MLLLSYCCVLLLSFSLICDEKLAVGVIMAREVTVGHCRTSIEVALANFC